MDRCQPISAITESEEKIFILLIEDADVLASGDSECYCYASSHFAIEGGAWFSSAGAALEHAMKRVQAISPIQRVFPTLGFDEFFDDHYLQRFVTE